MEDYFFMCDNGLWNLTLPARYGIQFIRKIKRCFVDIELNGFCIQQDKIFARGIFIAASQC